MTTNLRCACGSTQILSVAPGDEPEHAPGGFVTDRGRPVVAWCEACAPWLRGLQCELFGVGVA